MSIRSPTDESPTFNALEDDPRDRQENVGREPEHHIYGWHRDDCDQRDGASAQRCDRTLIGHRTIYDKAVSFCPEFFQEHQAMEEENLLGPKVGNVAT